MDITTIIIQLYDDRDDVSTLVVEGHIETSEALQIALDDHNATRLADREAYGEDDEPFVLYTLEEFLQEYEVEAHHTQTLPRLSSTLGS